MQRILFVLGFFFAYTLQAVTGFAGNIIAMPVGTATIGMTESVAVLNIAGFLACGLVAITSWKHIAWREFGKIIAVMIVFMLLGIWLDTLMPLNVLMKIYGVVVLGVGVKNLFFPQKRPLPEPVLWAVLALAGTIQGMFVSGGAFLVIYATQKIPRKEVFRATLSLTWSVLNFIYAGIAFAAGSMTESVATTVLWCVPVLIVATVLGTWIQKRISQERFMKITYILLMVIGATLIVT